MPDETYDSEEDDDYNPSTEKRVEGEKSESQKKRQRSEDMRGPEFVVGGRGKLLSSGTDPLEQLKADAKKAKINAIWETLNSKTKSPALPSNGLSHFGTSKKLGSQKKATPSVPSWMVSMGLAKRTPPRASSHGTPPAVELKKTSEGSPAGKVEASPQPIGTTESPERREDPTAAESLSAAAHDGAESPADLSMDGNSTADGSRPGVNNSDGTRDDSAGDAKKAEETGPHGKGVSDSSLAVAAAALAAAKSLNATTSVQVDGKLKVTEVRDFAGQAVEVTTLVDPNSKEALSLKRKAEMKAPSSSGIDSMLAQIERKKKLNILDKSRKDWGEYKEDKGVIEELELFKKSGSTYTEKVAFLGRADLREYEKERDARLAASSKRRSLNPTSED